MKSDFKICKNNNCGITILGLELDANGYLPEDSTIYRYRDYKWSETVTLNLLYTMDSEEKIKFVDYSVEDHESLNIDSSTITAKVDGIHSVFHMIIPVKSWVNSQTEDDLNEYETVVYYDRDLKKFYDYRTSEQLFEEKLPDIENLEETTIISSVKNTFSTCYLEKCFYLINKKLLGSLPGKCPSEFNADKLTYYRDILWMAINSIKYLIELSQLYEAQSILEMMSTCYSICDSIVDTKLNKFGCGCN